MQSVIRVRILNDLWSNLHASAAIPDDRLCKATFKHNKQVYGDAIVRSPYQWCFNLAITYYHCNTSLGQPKQTSSLYLYTNNTNQSVWEPTHPGVDGTLLAISCYILTTGSQSSSQSNIRYRAQQPCQASNQRPAVMAVTPRPSMAPKMTATRYEYHV